MTNRFARLHHNIVIRLGGRGRLALAIVGIWISLELLAVVAVAVAGREWLESDPVAAKTGDGGTSALGFSMSRTNSSVTVF